jgi:metal-dependent amidase/aminoacylase/carboxypeptidase family protein
MLRGTIRSFDPALRTLAHVSLQRIAAGVAASLGGSAEVKLIPGYPSTRNHAVQLGKALGVAEQLVGRDRVQGDIAPVMGGEDFAYMLDARPGAYLFIGAGSAEGGRNLHQTRYDFNDEILPLGASYWAQLAETLLPRA